MGRARLGSSALKIFAFARKGVARLDFVLPEKVEAEDAVKPETQPLTTPETPIGGPFSTPPVFAPELVKAAEAAKNGETPHRATVRTLLGWFHSQRRGSFVVSYIREALRKLGISTQPDFNSVWIDAEVEFVPVVDSEPTGEVNEGTVMILGMGPGMVDGTQSGGANLYVGGTIEDPTYRIGKLDAANKPVISVRPNHSVEEAVTLMLANGISQLPVMQSERDVKGVITWESIGARLALGKAGKEVREFMTSAQIISFDRSLFDAIAIIAQHQYVLVQSADRRIAGIVTSADLSLQFQQLSEPFLLLGEIEQHVRKLIVDKFTAQELKAACDPTDSEREIEHVADLTMGEYIRLLENPHNWGRLALIIDRAIFVDQLQTIRRIRNDVMHFDPDPLGPADLDKLRQFAAFMQSLRELGF